MKIFGNKDEREKIIPLINFESGVIPAPLKKDERIQAKLQYLDKLTSIASLAMTQELRDDLVKRMGDTCNDIEKDLSIKRKPEADIKCPLCGKPAMITNVTTAHSKNQVDAYCSVCDAHTDVIYPPGKHQPVGVFNAAFANGGYIKT